MPADIVGKKFNRLTVIRRDGGTPHGGSTWLCRCDCGNTKTVAWAALKRDHVKSCGCHYRANLGETRICACCKLEKPHSEFSKGNCGGGLNAYCRPCMAAKSIARYHANPQPTLRRAKALRAELRAEVLKAYGGKCVCCGESEPLFLAMDHKKNDGARHRREVGNGAHIYKWLRDNECPADFQILCANCNWGKHVNGGTCPHEAKRLG